jgi:hypothetical protein
MKAVSDSFRLWLSLRPAQRVGAVTSCFWGWVVRHWRDGWELTTAGHA